MGRLSKGKATKKIKKADKEKLNIHFLIPCDFYVNFQNVD
jgi:hypothetical protein